MTARARPSYAFAITVLAGLLAFFALPPLARAQAAQSIVPYLEQHLGLNEGQTRAALGVLLVFARERLPKPQFDQLARRMPNAELLMEQTRQRGIVTGPLDGTDDYAAALERLGIAPPVAARLGPTVLEFLNMAGYYEEHDVLSRVLD